VRLGKGKGVVALKLMERNDGTCWSMNWGGAQSHHENASLVVARMGWSWKEAGGRKDVLTGTTDGGNLAPLVWGAVRFGALGFFLWQYVHAHVNGVALDLVRYVRVLSTSRLEIRSTQPRREGADVRSQRK
jgi:hypothetical protein